MSPINPDAVTYYRERAAHLSPDLKQEAALVKESLIQRFNGGDIISDDEFAVRYDAHVDSRERAMARAIKNRDEVSTVVIGLGFGSVPIVGALCQSWSLALGAGVVSIGAGVYLNATKNKAGFNAGIISYNKFIEKIVDKFALTQK